MRAFLWLQNPQVFVTEADSDEKQQQEHHSLFPCRSINLLLLGATLFNMELWGLVSVISHSNNWQSLQKASMVHGSLHPHRGAG